MHAGLDLGDDGDDNCNNAMVREGKSGVNNKLHVEHIQTTHMML